MNMALSLSNGKSFACFDISRPYKVMLLSGEGGYYSNSNRLKKMCDSKKMILGSILHCWFDARFKLPRTLDVKKIQKLISTYHPEVLIIDPLIRFHEAEENSATEMSVILGIIRSFIEDYNLSIILVHHTGKNQFKNARGSSVILGEYDSNITIHSGEEEQTLSFDLRHAKSPNNINIKFDKDSYWFFTGKNIESIYQKVFRDDIDLSRSDLVERLMPIINRAKSTAYRQVDKDIAKGILVFRGGRYSLV